MKTSASLYVKNMVCPRCVEAVQAICDKLDIEVDKLVLGELVTPSITDSQKSELAEKLSERGFELLENHRSQLINQVKSLIVEHIHHASYSPNINFSTLISEKLNHEYSYLSRLFSSVEGITIEKYILRQKIERVKELIFYDELTLSEIAFKLNYSSSSHLSSQFKKETGMSPSAFKQLKKTDRTSLDKI